VQNVCLSGWMSHSCICLSLHTGNNVLTVVIMCVCVCVCVCLSLSLSLSAHEQLSIFTWSSGAKGCAPWHQVQQHSGGYNLEWKSIRLWVSQASRFWQGSCYYTSHGHFRVHTSVPPFCVANFLSLELVLLSSFTPFYNSTFHFAFREENVDVTTRRASFYGWNHHFAVPCNALVLCCIMSYVVSAV
jgi:hypothetical protein